ncbi:MAG: histidine kinase, partial [Roseimicrobium sp.]
TISFQIHYTPNGKAVEDQLKIGMIFAKEPPEYEVKVAAVANPRIKIPAGASDHAEVRQQAVPTDMLFSAFMAHMHVRGKAFKYEVTYPDGKTETLLDIPRYDFNWQLAYDYKQPKFVPRGSVVKITAIYDNSTGNPANPDPKKEVRWGSQTFDEMMIGYIEHFVPLPKIKVAENAK